MTEEKNVGTAQKKQGIVIKNTGSWYTVKTQDGEDIASKIKGNFRLKDIKSTNPVAIGDRVEIITNQEGTALITEIKDRKNYIIRKASNLSKQSHILAANIDLALLIVTIKFPETSTIFIDRFLASAEAYNIPVNIIFNKTDLLDPQQQEIQDQLIQTYQNIGYQCIPTSAINQQGIDTIKQIIRDKITLMSGNSGVGKSTIINQLIPDACLKTADISETHQTGTHTTTFSQMLELPQGGYIIDTPGIKGFGTFDIKVSELTGFFREIFEYSSHCKFNNCTHTHEPGCAVIAAVDNQEIAISRYLSYLNMMEDKDQNKYREAY